MSKSKYVFVSFSVCNVSDSIISAELSILNFMQSWFLKTVITQLKGETKKVFKKYADIKWTKNGDPWNPKSDGKSKFDGFIIRFSY